MKKIFTFGSCISRDIFNHTPEGMFDVVLNIQRMSYALLPLEGYPISYDDIDLEYLDDFQWEVKMMVTEMSRTAFDRIKDTDAEYVVIDLIEERFNFAEFTLDGKTYRCVNSGHFENYYNKYLKDKAENYRELSIDEYSDEEVRKYFDLSVQSLLKKFSIDKIILIETYYANQMIDDEGNLTKFENTQKIKAMNERLSRVYRIMKEVLDSHNSNGSSYNLLQADNENLLAYSNHKWGPYPVHYTDEFYENMGKKIGLITSNK